MITVRGRELVIPVAERQIGTQFDNNSETRQFKINRLTVGGIDISNLDFRIDLRYGKETKDTDVLEKEITDEHVILTWTVSAASVQQIGTVWIALRGSDDFGTIKWATNQGFLYVGKTINTPDGAQMALSELEKLEKRIDQKTESMDAAESSRVEAEKIRQENESARLKNEAEWQKQGEAAVEAAKTATAAQSAASASAEAAAGSAGTAGSAAQTATEAASAASASAKAASGSAGTASSAAQKATTAQNEASASAEAASGSAETASSAAQKATAAQSAASTSAEAAAGSAETASSAAQTATQKASEASSSASAAASDANVVKELIQGLGGFDGKASSVSAVDLLGLLGTENAKSTVQALIDVIADKVLNQLLSRSNVVNNALTTEEGYALDARMGKSLQDQITAQNSNFEGRTRIHKVQNFEGYTSTSDNASVTIPELIGAKMVWILAGYNIQIFFIGKSNSDFSMFGSRNLGASFSLTFDPDTGTITSRLVWNTWDAAAGYCRIDKNIYYLK